MKSPKKLIVLSGIFLLLIAIAGCGKKDTKEEKKALVAMGEDFPGYLHEKLEVPVEKVRELDPSEFHNSFAFDGKYYICVVGDECTVQFCIYDDETKARTFFEERYNKFVNTLNKDFFEGEYQNYYKDGYGYYVVNGKDLGTNVFGDLYVSGVELYAGVYYYGNTLLMVQPSKNVGNDKVGETISRLGLPMANGNNCEK